jgi:outer membrane protein assembly factor BamD (BamD/ComL family)
VLPGARLIGPLLLAAAMSAPFQCSGKVRPETRMEEEPAEALYKLAERFAARGDQRARLETLRFIVERYPSSRFSEMAKLDLTEAGVPLPASSASAKPSEGSR